MTSETIPSQGVAISAMGGVAIGLLLACLVIIGGLPFVLGGTANSEYTAFPALMDQRIAGDGPAVVAPYVSLQQAQPIVVADASELNH